MLVPVDLLDDNPWQPRTQMDERELAELMAAIAAQGLIQPIAARPRSDGRFYVVAGHRRAEAFRRLRDAATTETQRLKYSQIPAVMKVALDDAQMAAQAYLENMARAALTPLEEARALENMLEKGLAKSNEELAVLVQQNVARIRRLRRLAAAPKVVREAMGGGLMVVVSADAAGKEQRELRKLELMPALAFVRLFEHLKKEQPKKAEERVETTLRRALAAGWTFKRIEEHVDAAIAGALPEKYAENVSSEREKTPVFDRNSRRFVVDLKRLKKASAEQLARLREALAGLAEEAAEEPRST